MNKRSFVTLPALALLLSLMPRAGLAAPEGSEALLPGRGESSAPRLLEEPTSERPSRAVRIIAETGAGLLTSAGGGILGALAGYGLCQTGLVDSRTGSFACISASLIGLVSGFGLGMPLGVFWGGEAARGDARLLGTLGGWVGGLLSAVLIGVAVGIVVPFSPQLGSQATLVLVMPLSFVGSILGYELTERGGVSRRVQPVVSVSSRGALLGLHGTF